MKIIEVCPFYNEHIISDIHIKEARKWVDEFHLTESTRSFKYGKKNLCFNKEAYDSNFLKYHILNGDKKFKSIRNKIPHFEYPPISKSIKGYVYKNPSWRNEACQRNYSLWNCEYNDNDILVLSDIDEIIDSKHVGKIVDYVKKNGICTIKIHFTNFYFNLFCKGFGGPEDYSYRIFIVRGGVMRKRFYNDSDYLRKLGESGKLQQEVYCFPDIMGFHHSWLGDTDFVINKINSYAHDISDHASNISSTNNYIESAIRECVVTGKSFFPNTELICDNSINLLGSVEQLRISMPNLFFQEPSFIS